MSSSSRSSSSLGQTSKSCSQPDVTATDVTLTPPPRASAEEKLRDELDYLKKAIEKSESAVTGAESVLEEDPVSSFINYNINECIN